MANGQDRPTKDNGRLSFSVGYIQNKETLEITGTVLHSNATCSYIRI